jgi:5-methylcytosine-specific restriction endonuclease McrA
MGLSKQVRDEVLHRDGYACILCGRPNALQFHHVVRKSQGGNDYPYNLVTLCVLCHKVAHGERVKDYDFPFDIVDAEAAILEYLDYELRGKVEWFYHFGT